MVTEAVFKKAKKLVPIPDLFGLGYNVGKYLVSIDGTCSCGKNDCSHSTAVKIMKGEKIEVGKEELPNYCVNGLTRWDVVSAFHKELRRGDKKKVWYWLETMIQSKFPYWYIVNYIVGVLSEEFCTCSMQDFTDIKILSEYTGFDPHRLYAMTEKFCEAKKWWECKKCSDRRVHWMQIYKDVRANKEPIPYYAYDTHTSKGKTLYEQGKADMRWSGTWMGIMWRKRVFEAGLDPLTAKWNDVDMSDEPSLHRFENS